MLSDEKSPPMNEYIEKTSPMKFPPIITSPMDTEPTVPRMRPPIDFRERLSDELGMEKRPPMNFRDKPSDEHSGERLSDELGMEKGPPMNFREDPSDDDVRSAVRDLLELTRCRCHVDWTGRGLHERECLEPYRPDVTLLARRLGVGFVEIDGVGVVAVHGPGERGRAGEADGTG